MYKKPYVSNKIYLMCSLFILKIKKGMFVADYINKIKSKYKSIECYRTSF